MNISVAFLSQGGSLKHPNEYDHVITFLDRLFELFRLHVQFYLIKIWFSSFLIIDLDLAHSA